MVRTMTEKYMAKIIQKEIESRLNNLLPVIITEAQGKLERAIRQELAQTALSVMREFEVARSSEFLTIRVKR